MRAEYFRTAAGSIAILFLVSPLAADVIIKHDGRRLEGVSVIRATHEEVEYRVARIDVLQRLPGKEVREIEYTRNELLQAAAGMVLKGAWEQALDAYEQSGRDPRWAEPSAFGAAWTLYRQHVETGETGDAAADRLRRYLAAYEPKKGFHVPRALYLLGSFYAASGSFAEATEHFERLASFDGDARKLLAAIGRGRVRLARGEAERASSIFTDTLRRAHWADAPQVYRRALVWQGRSLLAQGEPRDAADFLREEIEDQPEDAGTADRFLAQACNVLGDAYAAAGDTESRWKALYRYLRTTVAFRMWRDECAEAFFKAGRLAMELGVEEDAQRLFVLLRSRYEGSVWTGKLASLLDGA